jgi:hypothetical protein
MDMPSRYSSCVKSETLIMIDDRTLLCNKRTNAKDNGLLIQHNGAVAGRTPRLHAMANFGGGFTRCTGAAKLAIVNGVFNFYTGDLDDKTFYSQMHSSLRTIGIRHGHYGTKHR